MNEKYRLAWRDAVHTHAGVAKRRAAPGKRVFGIRTLASVALAVTVAGGLGVAYAGGHVLGIEGRLQADEHAGRASDTLQATDGVRPPPRVTGVRGWY